MPVSPTYPGVYIEEIPSGVHTITGVATSVTAFIGYTPRGPLNEPVHIFSFADYERAFGGLSIDSPLSYAVKQFFDNGGTDAYVSRVANKAAAAAATLRNGTAGGAVDVLRLVAASEGNWGNNLRVDVDYATANPASLFNLRVTELVEQNGELVPGTVETFRNLSMNSSEPNYAITVIRAGSRLLRADRPTIAFTGRGASQSGRLTFDDLNRLDIANADPTQRKNRIAYTLNGQGPFEFDLATLANSPVNAGNFVATLAALANDIAAKITALSAPGVSAAPTASNDAMLVQAILDATHLAERSSIHFMRASRNDATVILKLGLDNGGVETDAAGAFRPALPGTTGTPLTITFPPGVTDLGLMDVRVYRGATQLRTIPLQLWGGATTIPAPASLEDVAARLRDALAKTASTKTQALPNGEPLLVGATAELFGGVLRVLPSDKEPNLSFEFLQNGTDTTVTAIGLVAGSRNVGRYSLGSGATVGAQVVSAPADLGNNGTPPLPEQLSGSELTKDGIYALEKVDLFNLLVMPDLLLMTQKTAAVGVLTSAIAYCERRRAFMIIDAPIDVTSKADAFPAAQKWIGGNDSSPLRSRNAALYFPRMMAPDPMRAGTVQSFGAAGALAGLYARTDAERGVWKAPAGTSATIIGATGLEATLTDRENGALNPLGLNCLRTFPVYGNVCWGARTSKGADALADEYKYIPVRRLALFLEESLYRGTQWAVFEPNDEPLWAQIRLNLGAFMHNLFAQGAFKGQTPRDAYFVRCDKETTTQNDIDLGRVNIIVGFAPLKPAEFVIIRIQQLAGQIQT